MTRNYLSLAAAALVFLPLVAASAARAQDVPQGVRLGLTYALGTRPGVLVLPTDSVRTDSIRAIIGRDIDYDDRATVVTLDDAAARALMPAAGDKFNYPVFAKLGVVAIIRPQRSLTGLTITMYDVASKRRVQTGSFPMQVSTTTEAGRLALHHVSDEIERWIFGTPGASASRILFSGSDKQIWLIDSDGAFARRMTSGLTLAMSPAWHPSANRFVFIGFTPRGSQVATFDFATGEVKWASATPRGLNITPVFSPDGASILYASGSESGTDLMAVDASDVTAPARRVTVGRGSDNTSPSFSPDGRQVAFMSGRAGHPEIFTMDVDGTNVNMLTDYAFGESAYRASPDWSPDGRTIAYQSRIAGDFQIMTIDLRDRTTKQYTSEGENEDPSWAPDARHLVFSSTRAGPRQLWVLDTESGRLRQLTHTAGARLPAWSPILKP